MWRKKIMETGSAGLYVARRGVRGLWVGKGTKMVRCGRRRGGGVGDEQRGRVLDL